MQKAARITLSLLLSALILLSGSGLIIGKMVCLRSGHALLQAGEAKDCCKDEDQQTTVRSKCCDIQNIVFNGEHFIRSNDVHLKTQHASFLPSFSISSFVASTFYPDKVFCTDFSPIENNAPPLPLLGVFRI